MTTEQQVYTIQDVLALPDDAQRYELVRGELRRTSPAGRKHGRLIMNISTPLDQFVREHELGVVYAAETGFILENNPDTLRAPDIAFVRQECLAVLPEEEGFFAGPPDLAIEFISPNDRYTEVDEKVRDYLHSGTRMVVVVNPRKETVTVYRSRNDIKLLTREDVLEGGDLLPGWFLPVSAIFA